MGKTDVGSRSGVRVEAHIPSCLDDGILFFREATLAKAVSGGVSLIADAEVPDGKKVYILGWTITNTGAVTWSAGSTHVEIIDRADTPVSMVKVPLADIIANATIPGLASAAVTGLWAGAGRISGGTAGKGIKVMSTNGSQVYAATTNGSDILVSVWGIIK